MHYDKARILIVDNDPKNLKLLEAQLLSGGYEVISLSSGEDALDETAKGGIDLILLDVMMPGMDGFEVTRRLKDDENTRLIPIVLVTALKDTEDRIKGMEAGCDDFISKPFDKNEVLSRVKTLLKVKAYHDHMRDYERRLEAEVAARTKQLQQAFGKIKSASMETIYRLSRAVEYKDENTGTHIRRMSHYASIIAGRMGIGKSMVETILYAAPMHDIGKIGIPDHILFKPEKLNPDEWEIMKQHTIIGGQILNGSDADFIKLGEVIALTHHEKWDGSGYPKGLKGEDIPLAGRITAVADVFDALTSKRPYRAESLSPEESFDIIGNGRGRHFDPKVVDAFFAAKDEILLTREKYNDQDKNPMRKLKEIQF